MLKAKTFLHLKFVRRSVSEMLKTKTFLHLEFVIFSCYCFPSFKESILVYLSSLFS